MKADFVTSALVLSWFVIAALVLVLVNVVLRLQRLEQGSGAPVAVSSHRRFDRVAGTVIGDLLPAGYEPLRAVVLVSASCRTCARLLSQLAGRASLDVPVLVALSAPRPAIADHNGHALPSAVDESLDGGSIAARIGVAVTPFAVLVDGRGRVVAGRPVNDHEALRNLVAGHTAHREPLEQEAP